MSDCLVYWKFLWGPFKGNLHGLNYEWFSRNENLLRQLKRGDNLWVVVTGGAKFPDEWRLLQRINVRAVRDEGCESEFPYHAIGDRKNSPVFEIEAQSDLSPRLHDLEFASGKRIQLEGRLIGRALQTIRPLSGADIDLLQQYTKGLKTR
jgi:hypothetical protein